MRRGVASLAVSFIASMLASQTALASSTVVVSGADPYSGCTVGGAGTNYPNTEVEPFLAANPHKPGNLIGAWQQDRWNNGAARGLVAGFSFNGGATWGQTELPFDDCAKHGLKAWTRATDPWVTIGPDGIAYTAALLAQGGVGVGGSAVAVSTSKNGGRKWERPVLVEADSTATQFNDKESLTADPARTGTAYLIWFHNGLGRFSLTTNGGDTWSSPRDVVTTGGNAHQMVINPTTGTLYDFFYATVTNQIEMVKSTDRGATWTAPLPVVTEHSVGVSDPNNPSVGVRASNWVPEPAIDRATGQLYVAWGDGRFNGGHYDEIAMTTSRDGGATWSTPVRISTPSGQPAFTPTVRVNSAGAIGVTYYDFRNLQAGNTSTLPTDYWLKSFTATQLAAATVDAGAADAHVSGSFNIMAAPKAIGYFLGDYQGLVTVGSTFHPFFSRTTCLDSSCSASSGGANPTDIYFE